MSGKFSMNDYVDVAERIRMFADRFPEGSLQSEVTFVDGGVLCKAYAYRSEQDARPGIGHAFEPVPGRTPYTKDSEVMNAETSAWGRAIVALGFETKKIASAQEVRNRSAGEPGALSGAGSAEAAPGTSAAGPSPAENGEPSKGSSGSPFQPPKTGKPTKSQLKELVEIVDTLIAAGELSNEQLQAAAKSDVPWPGMADTLTRDVVVDLTGRLQTYAKNKGLVEA